MKPIKSKQILTRSALLINLALFSFNYAFAGTAECGKYIAKLEVQGKDLNKELLSEEGKIHDVPAVASLAATMAGPAAVIGRWPHPVPAVIATFVGAASLIATEHYSGDKDQNIACLKSALNAGKNVNISSSTEKSTALIVKRFSNNFTDDGNSANQDLVTKSSQAK